VERIIIGQGLKHLVTIAVAGERLVATDAHPFYVRQAHDFVTAGQLQPGEQLKLTTGAWVTIASVQHQDQVRTVYNLSVSELHTFFAGDSSILVHNCGVTFPEKQLQREFNHAGDFGVSGNYNPQNAKTFQAALEAHINSEDTQVIQGTFRRQAATHYVNPETGLNVFTRPNGEFWSGWQLRPEQLANVVERGSL
jgi:hypothetical protein